MLGYWRVVQSVVVLVIFFVCVFSLVRPPGFGPGSLAWKANGRMDAMS
jgi:hypothetical protein